MDDHDDTPTDLETAQMMGRPEDFAGLMGPPPTDAELEALMRCYPASRLRGRVLAACRGEALESPMADLPRGVR